MEQKLVTIKNETGLHARPAAEFVKEATAWDCKVFLEKDGRKVNAKSVLGVLTLGVTKGSAISVITEGNEEAAALNKLSTFIENLEE